jgi:hypothetical protein
MFRTFLWLCGAVDGANVMGEYVDYSFAKDLFSHEDVNRRLLLKAFIYLPYHTAAPAR